MRRRTLLTALLPFAASPAFAFAQDRPSKSVSRERIRDARRRARAVRSAEWIVVARVKRVGLSPGVWCGSFATRQSVTYAIDETLVGQPQVKRLTLGHLLVQGSSIVSDRTPELRPDVFQPGARLVLHLRWGQRGWDVTDTAYGARPL